MAVRSALSRVLLGILILLVGWEMGSLHERSTGRVHIGEVPAMEGLVVPGATTSSGVTVHNPRRDVDASLVWDVWDQLIDHYIDPKKLQVTPLVYGAAEGLVRAVGDPYTVFMTPKENTEFRDSLAGNLEGIGAELTFKDGLILVVIPLKGSPAEKAGMKAKDIIEKVDDMSMEGMSLSQAVSKIRGPKGTTVHLTVDREKTGRVELSIVRDEIHVPSVESKFIEQSGKRIGYAALNQFGAGSIAELKTTLEMFKNRSVDGIILDLRNNGGGYLDGAVELTSLFVQQGTVVTVQRREGPGESLYVSGKVLFPKTPLVILQNEATASASEIVSGALQDYGRATIVGQKSFGKGTVQEVVDLPGGASLRVTIARWLTPKGKDLGKEGVHPDVVVEAPKNTDTQSTGEKPDPQLDAAVQVLLGKKAVKVGS